MLANLSSDIVFQFLLVFSRIAAAIAFFPAISNKYIFVRTRLAIAFTISLVCFPVLKEYLPSQSTQFANNFAVIMVEILIGIIISIGAKIYFLALNILGQIIAMQSGLGAAMFFDPNQNSQTAIFATFFSIIISAAIIITDTHHVLFYAIIESYQKFPPGKLLDIADMTQYIIYLVHNAMLLAFRLVSPFLVVSMMTLTAAGILSRLMPNFQVFFVLTPAQMLTLFAILYITIITIINKTVDSIAITLNLSM
ncbi:MAG: flagellar biosynthetic protein FliR [Rickettsiaceae bacterium]